MKVDGKKAYRKKNIGRLYKIITAIILIVVLCSLGILTVFAGEDREEEPAEPMLLSLESPDPSSAPEHHKYIKYNGEDSYTLNLDVKGLYDSSSEKRKIDVLLIIDGSGSMDEEMNNRQTRLDVIKEIVNEENGMAECILANANIDGRMAVVTYSGNSGKNDRAWNDASITSNWTSDQGEIISGVAGITADGGTNCQAGLRTAKEVLSSARTDAEKYVIFLSDGEPTYRYNSEGFTRGSGQDDKRGDNAKAAYLEVETISGLNGFYCVGIVSGDSENQKNFLETLNSKAKSTKKGTYFNDNAEELNESFQEITAQITEYTCRGVIITDTLSAYAEIVESQLEEYQVVVTDEEGNSIEKLTYNGNDVMPKELVSVTYDTDKKIVNAVFPQDYILNPNYTYTIQFQIKPSQMAYDAFLSGGYLHKGSEGSDAPGNDTSSEKAGFFTNTIAELQYIYGEEDAHPQSVSYVEQPVLQVQTGMLIVNKEVSGVMGDETKSFTVLVELYKKDGTPFTGTLQVIGETKNGIDYATAPETGMISFANGKVELSLSHGQQIRINDLPVGMTYVVMENTPEDYEVTYNGTAVEKLEGTIAGTEEVEIVNEKEYVPPTGLDELQKEKKAAILVFVIGMAGFAGFIAKTRHEKRKKY